MKKLIFSLSLLFAAVGAHAQKSLYLPMEWRYFNANDTLLYAESDPDNKYTWSKSRSVESDNVVIYWDKYYGNTSPTNAPETYRVNIEDLLKKCESFWRLESDELGFVDPKTSNVGRYKMMVLVHHSKDWICVGSGYDYQINALWLSPSTCKPVGQAVAHEVGHSFHYMCYCEDSNYDSKTNIYTGFHGTLGGGGQSIWEQTAQWQSLQSYPELVFDQSIEVFRNSHNYAYSHEWQRYQSYWFHIYLTELLNNRRAVADVWNYHLTGAPHEFSYVVMKQQGWTVKELYRHFYRYAAKCATFDFDFARPYAQSHIGDLNYRCVRTGDHAYQVAYASVPQATGFNVIPLRVADGAKHVTATFTSLNPKTAALLKGDPKQYLNGETQWSSTSNTTYRGFNSDNTKGFRLGYVALLEDGSRVYLDQDSIYCEGAGEQTVNVDCDVPEGTSQLWLVVSPAPNRVYEHYWNDKDDNTNDTRFPYSFKLEGADVKEGHATVYAVPEIDGRKIADATVTYDVYLPVDKTQHSFQAVSVSGSAAQTLGTAFQMQPTDIASKMVGWTSSGPAKGKIKFCAVSPKDALVNSGSTANGYGHWFSSTGNVINYGGSSYVYSEFDPASLTFRVGQYPGHLVAGKTYTVRQALVYRDENDDVATMRFIFRVHATNGEAGTEMAEMTYDDPTGIEDIAVTPTHTDTYYDLSGRQVKSPSQPGIYIVNGKKVMMRK